MKNLDHLSTTEKQAYIETNFKLTEIEGVIDDIDPFFAESLATKSDEEMDLFIHDINKRIDIDVRLGKNVDSDRKLVSAALAIKARQQLMSILKRLEKGESVDSDTNTTTL